MKQNFNISNTAFTCLSSLRGLFELIYSKRLESKIYTVSIVFTKDHAFSKCVPRFLKIAVFIISTLPMVSYSQFDVVNIGLPVINTNIDVIINGNLQHQNNGSISNTGNFYITGDLINDNSVGNVFTTGNSGWVHLTGANQAIGGSTITHFNNLELSGTGLKQLNNINTEIEDTLALNDREFASGDNTVFVMATGTGVVQYLTDGFVSSTNDGGLSRNTLAKSEYVFPVGSNTGTARFRPVDIMPNSSAANTFKVRMANVDATTENFNRSLKENTVGEINPNFYHRISRTSGTSPADITLFYDENLDSSYTILTQWQNTAQWVNLGSAVASSKYGFSGLTKPAFNNFSTTPFALSTEVASNVYIANVFSPNGDGTNDILHIHGVKGISSMVFIIYDRWGEKVFESSDVNAGWDGSYKGKQMESGVYVYFLKGKFKNGNVFDKKGNITLLR